MKRTAIILISLFTIFTLAGCNRMLGGAVLENLGMEFTSQIEMIEESLSIDLGDLSDQQIKRIYSHTDANGNNLLIQYIDFEGAGQFIEEDISSNKNWSQLPYDRKVEELLETSNANEKFDFANIKEGYCVLSGACFDKGEYDFNIDNFDKWYTFQIGLWDSSTETLYYIAITDQSKS